MYILDHVLHLRYPFGEVLFTSLHMRLGSPLRAEISALSSHRDSSFKYLFRPCSRFVLILTIKYLQFWISDCTVLGDGITPQQAVSQALIPLLIISPISAYLTPDISRKTVVYASDSLMILACAIMIFSSQYFMSFIISGLFGLGFGPFLSVEFAMMLGEQIT
jgi:MFS family permease